jgi:hypothetical protein
VSKVQKLINAVLPPVPKTDDRQTLQFFSAIKQALDEIKQSVVVSKQGVVSRLGSTASRDELEGVVSEAVTDPDALKTPSAVANLTASGTVTAINLSWNYPATGSKVSYFEVFRNTANAQGTATIRGTTGASVFSDSAEPRQQYYYWVRGVSSGGVLGPFQSTTGVAGITAVNPLTTLATAQCGIVCSDLANTLINAFPSISGADCALLCANTANNNASTAQSCADAANIAAGTAQSCADAACVAAGTAQSCSDTAQCCANVAQSCADAACLAAGTAQTCANAANTAAGTAQCCADAACLCAGTAQTCANTANTAAGTAQCCADAACLAAGTAQTCANTANTAAGTAQCCADAACLCAGTAQTCANAANTAAGTAQCCADAACLCAGTAQSCANAANTAAGTAQTCADTAQCCADAACVTAGTAQSCADAACLAAGTAQSCATTANTAAGVAQGCANAACACATTAIACSATALTAANNGCSAAIQAQCTIDATNTTLSATYILNTNVDGYVSGFGLYNSGVTSDFLVLADNFSIVNNPVLASATNSNATVYCCYNMTGYAAYPTGPQLAIGQGLNGAFLQIQLCNYTAFCCQDIVRINVLCAQDTSGADVITNCSIPFCDFNLGGTGYVGANICACNVCSVTFRLIEERLTVPFAVTNNQVLLNTAVIGDASITDAMIQCLSANKISVSCLSALNSNMGCITAGCMTSTDGNFVIDLTNKSITISV